MATGQPNGQMPAVPKPPAYTGLPYGEKTQMAQMAKVPTGPAPMVGPTGAPQGPPPGSPDALLAEAQAAQPPQQSIMRPSERPGEPVTAGLAQGPGVGPEALSAPPQPRITQMLDMLASITKSPAVASLAAEAASRNL